MECRGRHKKPRAVPIRPALLLIIWKGSHLSYDTGGFLVRVDCIPPSFELGPVIKIDEL